MHADLGLSLIIGCPQAKETAGAAKAAQRFATAFS